MSNAEQQQNESAEEVERELSEDELEAVRGGGKTSTSSGSGGSSLPGVGGNDPDYQPPSYLPSGSSTVSLTPDGSSSNTDRGA